MSERVITADELNSILKSSGLGELGSPLERLTNGWSNITIKFQIKSDGKCYIVRQYRPSPFRKISRFTVEFELNFLRHLHDDLHLPVVSMLDPPGLLTINDDTFVVFFPFIDGIKYLDNPLNPIRQLWQTLEIGRFLGRMHSNVVTGRYSLSSINRCSINYLDVKYELVHSCEQFNDEYPDFYQRIRRITDQSISSIPLIENEEEQKKYQEDLEKSLPFGYIHADLHDDNVLFHRNEKKLLALLDFDDMYIGPFLIDIALTMTLWCSIGSQFNFDYAKEFLRIYENERQMSLTDDEWKYLQIYCYLTILNQILFLIEAQGDRQETENFIEELLLPIEEINRNSQMFLEKLRERNV